MPSEGPLTAECFSCGWTSWLIEGLQRCVVQYIFTPSKHLFVLFTWTFMGLSCMLTGCWVLRTELTVAWARVRSKKSSFYWLKTLCDLDLLTLNFFCQQEEKSLCFMMWHIYVTAPSMVTMMSWFWVISGIDRREGRKDALWSPPRHVIHRFLINFSPTSGCNQQNHRGN